LALTSVSALTTVVAAQRPFTVDDVFALESIGTLGFGGGIEYSQDGQKLAVVRVRALMSVTDNTPDLTFGALRADVWLRASADTPLENLTNGLRDQTGWWAPSWSPDGRVLLMLSSRGGRGTVWSYDSKHRRLSRLTSRSASFRGRYLLDRPYTWVDATHVLCPLLSPGQEPFALRVDRETPQVAASEWNKISKGAEVTASVLESGAPDRADREALEELVLLNVLTGETRVVTRGQTAEWQPSPTGNAVAYIRRVSDLRLRSRQSIRDEALMGSYVVDVIDVNGNLLMTSSVPDTLTGHTGSLRWSWDGRKLAFLAGGNSDNDQPDLYVADLSTRRVTKIPLGSLDLEPLASIGPQLSWTAGEKLIALGARHNPPSRLSVEDRRDWWLISDGHVKRCLTCSLEESPKTLYAERDGKRFVGFARGRLWRLSSDLLEPVDLPELGGHLEDLEWPGDITEAAGLSKAIAEVVVSVRGRNETQRQLVELGSRRVSDLRGVTAQVRAYNARRKSAIFEINNRDGTAIVETNGADSKVLMEVNTFLRDVFESPLRAVQYQSQRGESLTAWILLPLGYHAGQRYPVIAWIYPGAIMSSTPPRAHEINSNGCCIDPGAMNMQIAAAHGYLVIIPSMPLPPEGEPAELISSLQNGVMPALDEVIGEGTADPDRVFVMGMSFGGFATCGIVTQTNRFKAAVALAGISDLVSNYTEFNAEDRYDAAPLVDFFVQSMSEVGQLRMMRPPWEDPDRYVRNSPLFFAGNVTTPVLLIHGDLDFVGIQQSEAFFTALYRQGKPARFVRYWGEDHAIHSPANIRDMWNQIFNWLARYGGVAP
jgi:dipeptidyl aminopeptidase/acylaminoacyl peptidase